MLFAETQHSETCGFLCITCVYVSEQRYTACRVSQWSTSCGLSLIRMFLINLLTVKLRHMTSMSVHSYGDHTCILCETVERVISPITLLQNNIWNTGYFSFKNSAVGLYLNMVVLFLHTSLVIRQVTFNMATDKTINNMMNKSYNNLCHFEADRATFLHQLYHLGKKVWHWDLALWCMHCRWYYFWNSFISIVFQCPVFSGMKSTFAWSFTDWVSWQLKSV